MGKSGPNVTFDLFFLGLGWPWVGEFVGFVIMFTCFPTQQNLVNRKHRIIMSKCVIAVGWFTTAPPIAVSHGNRVGYCLHKPHVAESARAGVSKC